MQWFHTTCLWYLTNYRAQIPYQGDMTKGRNSFAFSFLWLHSRNSCVYETIENSKPEGFVSAIEQLWSERWKKGGKKECLHCSSATGSLASWINWDVLTTQLLGNQQAMVCCHSWCLAHFISLWSCTGQKIFYCCIWEEDPTPRVSCPFSSSLPGGMLSFNVYLM